MAPRLRVLAGTSIDTMVHITSFVNTNKAHRFSSDQFQGEIVVNIKGFTDPEGRVKDSEYFARADRQGITWSIQVQGRFLNTYSADDILFGNTFDRPLKLPWGSSAALKFMHFVDPTLEHDLTSSTKPWALSPLISTMPHFTHTRIPVPFDDHPCDFLKPPSLCKKKAPIPPPPFPPPSSLCDDTSQLYLAVLDSNSSHGSDSSSDTSSISSVSSTLSSAPSHSSVTSHSSAKSKLGYIGAGKLKQAVRLAKRRRRTSLNQDLSFDTASQRRSYFGTPSHRRAIHFGPEDMVTTDFCYGFLEFSPSLTLRLPGGLSFDLAHYWDGQPVRFVCCERKSTCTGDGEDPWGSIFWCVSIEMADDNPDIHENDID